MYQTEQLRVLTNLLPQHGWTPEEAVNHDLSNIGLIFMDIGLPGIDGITATTIIRRKKPKPVEQQFR